MHCEKTEKKPKKERIYHENQQINRNLCIRDNPQHNTCVRTGTRWRRFAWRRTQQFSIVRFARRRKPQQLFVIVKPQLVLKFSEQKFVILEQKQQLLKSIEQEQQSQP